MISRLYEKKQVNSLQERSSHEEIPEDQILCSDFRPNPGTWMKVFLSILIPEVNHIICRKGGATILLRAPLFQIQFRDVIIDCGYIYCLEGS